MLRLSISIDNVCMSVSLGMFKQLLYNKILTEFGATEFFSHSPTCYDFPIDTTKNTPKNLLPSFISHLFRDRVSSVFIRHFGGIQNVCVYVVSIDGMF